MAMSVMWGPQTGLSFSHREWAYLLMLAHHGGWRPAGTEAPPWEGGGPSAYDPERHGPWCGSYTSNEGQVVTDEDARALADGLERALAEGDPWLERGDTRRQDFIAYCRRHGSFDIW